MNFKHSSLSILTAALLAGSTTLAFAEAGSVVANPGPGATSASQSADPGDTAVSSQQKSKKKSASKNSKKKSGSANCPPEHKAKGHC